jgi:hypothetical protein
MAREPGRNEPCPCGSGRKYKQCCLRAAESAGQARLAVRRAEARVIDAASAWALGRFGEPFFGQALGTFFLGAVPDAELEDIPEFNTMFQPWFALEFVGDPTVVDGRPDWPDQPTVRHWLDTERPNLTTLERDWLEAACKSPMSALVVEAVEPGRSVDLRDILTGRRFHALEESGSRMLQPAFVLFTRVVTVGDVTVMLGAAPIAMPPEWQLRVIDWRDMTFGRRRTSRGDLVRYAEDIRELYLDLADGLYNPVPPQLRNTDGDEVAFTTLQYTLSIPAADAYVRLVPLATMGKDIHEDGVVRDRDGRVTSATLSWLKPGNAQHRTWDNTILGTLRLAADTLTAEVNSVARADRIAAEFAERLGAGAALVSRSALDVATALAERAEARAAGKLDDEPDAEPRPPEFAEMEDELFRQHAMEWIDTEVPALGGITPRAAVRTLAGRERVEALVAGFARGRDGFRPAVERALADMRRELRLDEPAAGDFETYTLKVTLIGIRPPVWRRLEAPADLTLAQLHRVLQAALGWTGSHLHIFVHDGVAYGDSRRDLDLGCSNEKTTRLRDLLWEAKDSMEYEYDFGDGWRHRIVLESSRAAADWQPPRLLAGKRARPPEDVGGIGGYADFCEAMARPDHPEHQAMFEWYGRPFDPNAFDLDEAGAAVARLRLRPLKPRRR